MSVTNSCPVYSHDSISCLWLVTWFPILSLIGHMIPYLVCDWSIPGKDKAKVTLWTTWQQQNTNCCYENKTEGMLGYLYNNHLTTKYFRLKKSMKYCWKYPQLFSSLVTPMLNTRCHCWEKHKQYCFLSLLHFSLYSEALYHRALEKSTTPLGILLLIWRHNKECKQKQS